MAHVNLLFLAPHWRVSLIRAFQESWNRHGFSGRLIGADSDLLAAAHPVLESSHPLPRFDQPECANALISICQNEKIQAIVPLTNKAIDFLDGHRTAFEGVETYLPSSGTIEVCHDKWKLYQYLNGLRLPTPETWLPDDLPESPSYPLISKPRRGEGSQSCFRIESAEELGFFRERNPQNVLQRWLEGEEYSIDWFSDRTGEPKVVIPRIRLTVKAGEVMQSRIDLDANIIDAAQVLGRYLGLRGPATLQGIRTADGVFHFTDINLRFGSGYVHSLAAGADVPAMILSDLTDGPPELDPLNIQDGLIMTRYLDGLFQ